jgi:predicted nucleic-acid-binding Zn-ribbon protein
LKATKEQFERDFVCPKCHGHGAVAQDVSLKRGGVVSSMLPLSPTRYLAVSCGLCGYTEFYLLAIVEKETEPEELPAIAKLVEKPK